MRFKRNQVNCQSLTESRAESQKTKKKRQIRIKSFKIRWERNGNKTTTTKAMIIMTTTIYNNKKCYTCQRNVQIFACNILLKHKRSIKFNTIQHKKWKHKFVKSV